MAIAKQNSSNARSPAMIMIGKTQLLLRVQSQRFRRLVRTIAMDCAIRALEEKQLSSKNLPLLKRRYQNAIFSTLAMGRNGCADPQVSIFDAYNFDDTGFWDILMCAWTARQRVLTAPQQARLRRIKKASTTCSVQIVRDGIATLEKKLALQLEFGISNGPRAAPKDAGHSTPLIQVAIPWSASDPELQVGVDGSFFGYSTLHPSVISNSMTIGGTGSGKSQSVVMPLLNALLRYELSDGKVASILVVDPKRELIAKVRSTLAERGELDRLVVIGECRPVPLFTKNSPLSMSDRLVKLEVFGPMDSANGDHAYWKNLGMSIVLDFLQLESSFNQRTGGKRLVALMCRELKLPNTIDMGFWPQFRAVLGHSRTSKARLKVVDELLRSICLHAGIEHPSTNVLHVYTGDDDLMKQWCYAIQSAEPVVNSMANPDISRFVDLDPIQTSHRFHTDIPDLIEKGKVVVFCPEPTEGHRVAALALKQKFFESVFSRSDQRRPVGIVIDECQKFITNDRETGEQGFLDRCRAYRCLVVMATQSISALKHAMGSNNAAQTAVDIVTSNTPSKFIFRTTDAETVAWLRSQLPAPSEGDPHIIDVRRPATLQPGECYFLLANGEWGRRRARLTTLSNDTTFKG